MKKYFNRYTLFFGLVLVLICYAIAYYLVLSGHPLVERAENHFAYKYEHRLYYATKERLATVSDTDARIATLEALSREDWVNEITPGIKGYEFKRRMYQQLFDHYIKNGNMAKADSLLRYCEQNYDVRDLNYLLNRGKILEQTNVKQAFRYYDSLFMAMLNVEQVYVRYRQFIRHQNLTVQSLDQRFVQAIRNDLRLDEFAFLCGSKDTIYPIYYTVRDSIIRFQFENVHCDQEMSIGFRNDWYRYLVLDKVLLTTGTQTYTHPDLAGMTSTDSCIRFDHFDGFLRFKLKEPGQTQRNPELSLRIKVVIPSDEKAR